MAKQINTRIQLKYDSYENWTKAPGMDLVLGAGEIGLCAIPSGSAEATTAPTVLFKVGDGTNKFSALKWGSALAADVYDWAKKPTLDVDDLPTLPIVVIDNESGKFVTDIEYGNDQITIHRADAVNTLAATDDDVVILTVDKSTGDVTIDGQHAKKGPTNGYTGAQAANSISAFGETITIKVPKLTVDDYGHTNAAEDVEYSIALPTPEAATNTVTLASGKDAIKVEDKATDGNHNYEVSLILDDSGNVELTQSEEGLKANIDLSGYKIRQEEITETLTGAQVIASIHQTENGEISITPRTLTPADLGLDTVMHFIGAFAVAPTKAFVGTANERDLADGDVYLNTANATEYVYSNNKWVELGNEESAGSHALKTISITGNDGLEGGGTLEQNRTIGIKDSGVTTDKIADKAVTKVKLAEAVQTSLELADNSKQKQTAYNAAGSTTKTVTNVTQNANGEITVTYGDIAFPEVDIPAGSGAVTTASVVDGVVTLNGGVKLNDHALEDDDSKADITLAKVATTGSTDDLDGGEEVWVFYCGNASDDIFPATMV